MMIRHVHKCLSHSLYSVNRSFGTRKIDDLIMFYITKDDIQKNKLTTTDETMKNKLDKIHLRSQNTEDEVCLYVYLYDFDGKIRMNHEVSDFMKLGGVQNGKRM